MYRAIVRHGRHDKNNNKNNKQHQHKTTNNNNKIATKKVKGVIRENINVNDIKECTCACRVYESLLQL